MNNNSKKYLLLIILVLLVIVDAFLIYQDYKDSRRMLKVAMLDVGQGDAIFVESPSGTQVLFDAGPPRKILGSLQKVMSPFDRSIDAVVITNPDADHIGGISEILDMYKVGAIFSPGTMNRSKTFNNLKNKIISKNIPEILARKGMVLDLGNGAEIKILFPDRDVHEWSTNDGSIVARLTYGETSVILTGDSTSKTEKLILENNSPEKIDSDILKVGHHGSRSSTSDSFTKIISPTYALISSGKGNSYGHPHTEVLQTLEKSGAKVFRTDLLGTIILISDGQKETFSFRR